MDESSCHVSDSQITTPSSTWQDKGSGEVPARKSDNRLLVTSKLPNKIVEDDEEEEEEEEREENSSDGYLIFTFSDRKKAKVKSAAFADVSEAGLPDEDSYMDEGDDDSRGAGDVSGSQTKADKAFYGEAYWVGEEDTTETELRPNVGAQGGLLSHESPEGSSARVRGLRPRLSGPLGRGRRHMPMLSQDTLSGDQGRKMLRCEECGKYYRNEYSLKHHICLPRKDVWKKGDIPSEVVNGKVMYFCPTCNKPFKWLGNLTRHFYVHTGQRFFKCEVCDKEFFSAYQVKRHMNSHTGLRFKCEVCDKPFTCKYACAWHTRQHYTYAE